MFFKNDPRDGSGMGDENKLIEFISSLISIYIHVCTYVYLYMYIFTFIASHTRNSIIYSFNLRGVRLRLDSPFVFFFFFFIFFNFSKDSGKRRRYEDQDLVRLVSIKVSF